MPKAKSKRPGRTAFVAWGDMAEKFLSKLDSEHYHHAEGCHGSERDCAAQVLQHFTAWVVDRTHHYQDDGYLIPFPQTRPAARKKKLKR